jgi:hypothetical protein
MTNAEKTCPDCAETVKAAARKCRYCGQVFDDAVSSSPNRPDNRSWTQRTFGAELPEGGATSIDGAVTVQPQGPGLGTVALILVGLLIALGAVSYFTSGPTPEQEAHQARIAELEAQSAALRVQEQKTKGFHCLSGWDGSHSGLVDAVKAQLRDPDSFEHDETRVTPATGGAHTIYMKFRSRNGFGGLNVGVAQGKVSNSTCAVTVDKIVE